MKNIKRIAFSTFIVFVLILNVPPLQEDIIVNADTEVTPSKSWGVFFHSGLAVKILVPREFLEGFAENDTSFLNSTITNDYFYYLVLDEASYYPYKYYSPYRVEVHSPDYVTFSPPQKVFFKNILAPSMAGTYNFTVYTATSLNSSGLPDFKGAIIENLTIPVSMREDPGFISGMIVDPEFQVPITAEGIIYAKEVNTDKMAMAYVNYTTGSFNITGLYAGDYLLSGSASYCSITGYAYITTEYSRFINISKAANITNIIFPLQRGVKIDGFLKYFSASSPGTPMRSIMDNAWFGKAGIQYLNYTVEAYDEYNNLVAEYVGISQGDKTWDPYWLNGTRYSGFGPGWYSLKVWAFGYVHKEKESTYIPLPEQIQSQNISLVNGGSITCVLTLPQTPRKLEEYISGMSSGALLGGNVLAEAYDEQGVLKGVTLMNYTYANETVAYADETKIRFYILGFSDFYNKTYSGVWIKKDYGLEDGDYYIRVFLKGFLQEKDIRVTITAGSNSTASIKCIPGGVLTILVESVEINPSTKTAHPLNWTFPGRFLRVWMDGSSAVGRGEIFDLHTDDLQLNWTTQTYWYKVTPTNATIWYCGNNWSLRHIIHYGAVPSALSSGEYSLRANTYGYIQENSAIVKFEIPSEFELADIPTIVRAYIRLQRGPGIEGRIIFMREDLNVQLEEKVFLNIKIKDNYGRIKGIQIGTAKPGAYFSDFSIFGYYNYTPSGYKLPTHFYYVTASGFRVKDYGMEPSTINIKVDEVGFDTRFLQTKDVKLTLDTVYEIKSIFMEIDEMGMVFGVVKGRNSTDGLIPLSWVKVSSDERYITSLDGNFRLFLVGGTHTIDFSIPGYLSRQKNITVHGAGAVDLNDVLLEQSGLPFYSRSVEIKILIQQSTHNEKGIEYILKADIDSEIIDPSLIDVIWYADYGIFNSTYGKCVSFIVPDEASFEDQTIIATAFIPEYGKIGDSYVLNTAEIPEFNNFTVPIIFAISIAFTVGILRRKEHLMIS
ncbi:hypothetical protein AC481_02550 [miscellaneous Crenarchaeota group archaeon SMTZ-80]|nr:MAG: hypothetical protein AC481_02550 [miscellaneous Crenarchaeota group archaeon SMTZ-80]